MSFSSVLLPGHAATPAPPAVCWQSQAFPQSCCQLGRPLPRSLWGACSLQGQDWAFVLAEFHTFPLGSFLSCSTSLLNGSPSLQCTDGYHQLSVTCTLESVLHCLLYIIDKDFKKDLKINLKIEAILSRVQPPLLPPQSPLRWNLRLFWYFKWPLLNVFQYFSKLCISNIIMIVFQGDLKEKKGSPLCSRHKSIAAGLCC